MVLARMSQRCSVGIPAALTLSERRLRNTNFTESAMKKILATLTVLVITSVSASAFASGCGNNAGRNANTRPTTSTPVHGGGDGAGVRR